jgi:hypothetical protein
VGGLGQSPIYLKPDRVTPLVDSSGDVVVIGSDCEECSFLIPPFIDDPGETHAPVWPSARPPKFLDIHLPHFDDSLPYPHSNSKFPFKSLQSDQAPNLPAAPELPWGRIQIPRIAISEKWMTSREDTPVQLNEEPPEFSDFAERVSVSVALRERLRANCRKPQRP